MNVWGMIHGALDSISLFFFLEGNIPVDDVERPCSYAHKATMTCVLGNCSTLPIVSLLVQHNCLWSVFFRFYHLVLGR
jgi:hypothetical protein